MSFLLLLFYVTNVILKALKQRLQSLKTRTEVLPSARWLFSAIVLSNWLCSFHPRESLYCSIQSPCRRRGGVIHLFWLADQQRAYPFSRRKRARARPPP
jgi:hypothetical protein